MTNKPRFILLAAVGCIMLIASTAFAAIGVDQTVFRDQTSPSTFVTTQAFSTAGPNELLLAFVSADVSTSSGTNNSVTSVTGAGLAWVLVRRANTQRGTAEIWRAFASVKLTNVTVRANLATNNVSSITVMSFTGVNTSGTSGSGAIGNTGAGSGATGSPTASLVTLGNNSLVVGVGEDWNVAPSVTAGASQAIVHQIAIPNLATFWVQRRTATTPSSGTTVTINDTVPTNHIYNLAICEILAESSSAPSITSLNTATFVVGSAGSFAATATGTPSPTFSETGTLPVGVTFTAAGVLSGTPAAGSAGTYPLTITAQNGVLPNATQNFTLTVRQAPTITSSNNTTFELNTVGSFTVTATGFPAPTFSETGVLPAGVTFANASGVLSGTPTVTGTFPITFTAQNGVSPNATQNFTLTVNGTPAAPAITSTNSTTFVVGSAGSFNVAATGFPAPTFTEIGALPAGVTLTAAGVLSGTPAVGTAGTYPLTITAQNGISPDATQNFTLIVNQAPAITSGNSTMFIVGTAGSFTVTAAGSPAPTLSRTGTLPAGVTFDTASGILSGTPTASGAFPITFTAQNGVSPSATQNFTLTVNMAPTITSTSSTTLVVGSPGSFTVAATGFPTPTFSEAEALPAGVILTAAGVLSGTPAAGTAGTYPLTITAQNGVSPNATQNFMLTVHQAPAITSGNGTTFSVGTAGSFTVTATGSPAPTFSQSGALPAGVTFTTAGVLSGTPNSGTAGTYPLTFTAQNGVLPNATQNFTLTVNPPPTPPVITSTNSTTFVAGSPGSFTVTATGSPAPTFSQTGTLPAGVTFTAAGVLSGTPSAAGTYPLTITAQNGVLPNATQNFTLTVNQAPVSLSIDVTQFKDNGTASNTIVSPAFSTTSGNELLLAFMASDYQPGQSSTNVSVTGVTGGGLTWVLVRRTNTQSGTAEIWRAFSPSVLANITVTATLSQTVQSSMTVMAFKGVDTSGTNGSGAIGAIGGGNATSGGPTATLVTTRNNSWVVGVGNDYDNAIARTVGTSQTLVHQFLSPINDTYWVQRQNSLTPLSSTSVTINDTAPTGDRYNLSICEILPAVNVAPAAPTITSTNSATFTAGTAGSFTATATGFPQPSFSQAGAMPAGVTFTAGGLLSGTPAAGTGGTYPLTITAQNGVLPNATQSFTLTVRQAPAISSTNSTTFTVGTAGSFTVTATGSPAPTFSQTGTLPAGVTFTAAGLLSGSPAAGTAGTYPLTFTAQNGVLPNATQNFALTVSASPTPPAITSTNGTTFMVGSTGSFTVTATGSPTPTFSRTGALPAGVTFTAAGVLSGTPGTGTAGTYPLTITAQNGVLPNATQNFTLTVNQPASGPITLRQKNVNGNEGATSNMSVSFSSNNTAGNFLIVTGTAARPARTITVSDTLGNIYSTAFGPVTDPAQDVTMYVWYVPVCKGGANTVTITPSGGSSALEIHVSEWSGIATVSPVDQTTFATGTGTNVSSGARTTTANGELIFGYGWVFNNASPGSGFTSLSLVNGDLDEYQVQSTAGSIAATFTQANGAWFAGMVTFKPLSATPPALLSHVGGAAGHPAVSNQTYSLNYRPVGTGNAVVVFAGCASPGITSMSLSAPGWTLTPISGLVGPSGFSDFMSTFGAIAPNTNPAAFTVTLTGGNGNCSSDATIMVDEFSGNDISGGTTTFEAHNESLDPSPTGVCTGAPVTPANNNDAIWYACYDNVTGVTGGYTKGQDDGVGDWTEYKILSGGLGITQNPSFTTTSTTFALAGVAIKAAQSGAPAAPANTSTDITSLSTDGCGLQVSTDIVCENSKAGTPEDIWGVDGFGDETIQGFATDISVNRGETAFFKIKTPASSYRLDIYRMGYYGGDGARLIATVNPSANLPQNQPACVTDAATRLYDCGNWSVSASWPVPADATSGVYFARLVRTDTGGASHIFFIVRNDASHSDIVYQTSDTSWQAYNAYGGNSLYGTISGVWDADSRAYKVSYNRPFNTFEAITWIFGAEYPMIRWLEANGFDVTYSTDVDSDRNGTLIRNHKIFMSTGHDEYWSGGQRTNVEAARDAGVSLAFFSGNEVFWKTRWENSTDGSGTPYRTLVCYKETLAAAKIDPTSAWTGTWRDPRFSPPADGSRPENSLTGTIFAINGPASDNNGLSIKVPAADGKMRFWRNTSIANLSSGTATLPQGTLGYEWDVTADNGSQPAGLIYLSTTTQNLTSSLLLDYGGTFGSGTATHHLTMYRAPSGALVFGAGTVQWSWGLDNNHENPFGFTTPGPSTDMRQATINLFADMDVQPATIQSGLLLATKSTDATPPTSTITSPAAGASLTVGTQITISGTASDPGGVVGGVEVSVDGGETWHPASGRANWNYSFRPTQAGSYTLRSRAVDDSGNIEIPGAGATVFVH